MGCELNPQIPYTEFSVIIKKQKEVSLGLTPVPLIWTALVLCVWVYWVS